MKRTFVVCLLAIALSTLARTASAQVNVYMLVPGVPGGSTNARHAGWIDVLSLQQELTLTKKAGGCSLKVVKPLDVAGPRLWLAAVTGQVFSEVRIELTRPGADETKFYEIRLTNAQVSAMSDGGGGSANVTETVQWSAASAVLTFFNQNPDGSIGSQVTATIPCN